MPVDATATVVLDREFLELRARLLQVASQLDRLDRAPGSVGDDPRVLGIRRAIEVLAGAGPQRAEQIQLIFSRPYDAKWKELLNVDSGAPRG